MTDCVRVEVVEYWLNKVVDMEKGEPLQRCLLSNVIDEEEDGEVFEWAIRLQGNGYMYKHRFEDLGVKGVHLSHLVLRLQKFKRNHCLLKFVYLGE